MFHLQIHFGDRSNRNFGADNAGFAITIVGIYGKPRIVGTRITVAAIAEMYLEMEQSLEEIAVKYDLSLAAVHGAMAYYYDHREEIDRHNLETERLVAEIKLNTT